MEKRKYGPNIVRAWFDTVIYYALRGLENEREFLEQRNWTFSHQTLRLEYLVALAKQLPPAGRENLEQMVSFFPDLQAKIGQHDNSLNRLEQSCQEYFKAIMESAAFHTSFDAVAKEAPAASGKEFSANFGAYSSERDFMALLAEYLVNNTQDLPSYYSTADLWNRYGDRFRQSIADLALSRDVTFARGDEALKTVENAASALRTLRLALSIECDLPYVTEVESLR